MARHHLVVVQHGLHGEPAALANFRDALEDFRQCFTEDIVICHFAESNWGFRLTHHGIDECGKRLASEIELLRSKHHLPSGTLLTLIGHSMGGLIARYAAGILLDRGLFADAFVPAGFITFATPHLGTTRSPRGWIVGRALALVCSYGLGRTGPQFILEDTDADDSGRSLLVVMSDPTQSFAKALAMFKVRTLYGNIYNDPQVPCCTALIIPRNPFRGVMANEPIDFHPEYPHVAIIDDEHYHPADDTPFVGNPKKDLLMTMTRNLSQLQWNRHPVYFGLPGAAHGLIAGISHWRHGVDVLEHAIHTYLEPFHARNVSE